MFGRFKRVDVLRYLIDTVKLVEDIKFVRELSTSAHKNGGTLI